VKIEDFFFGDVYISDDSQEHSISLRSANELASICGVKHFTAQIRRFLRTHGLLVLTEGTSHPPFPELIKHLETEEIGLVQIGAREDVNSNVPATLDCSLMFVEGIVSVRPHWTAYKEIRADEIVTSLLVPLHESGLIGRTITQRTRHSVELISSSVEQQINVLFGLSGFPYDSLNHGRIENYLRKFENKA